MSELSEKIRKVAIENGMCRKYDSAWEKNPSIADMTQWLIKDLDFCLKTNFPSLAMMEKYGEGIIEKYGMYCNKKNVDLDSPKRVILHGDSYADIFVMSKTSEIDVRHTSKVKVKAVLGASVWVNLHDYATAEIICESGSKVFVHKYGSNTVKYSGNVKITERKGFYSDKLYLR